MQDPTQRAIDNGCLYDVLNCGTATTSLNFFSRSRSAGLARCNLRQANQLPLGESFEVRAFGIGMQMGGDLAAAAIQQFAFNAVRLFHAATLTFTIQSKPVIDAWPLETFNPGYSIPQGPTSESAAASGFYFGAGTPSDLYRFPHPFKINSNETFAGLIQWDVAPAGLGGTVGLFWRIFGTHIRSVQ